MGILEETQQARSNNPTVLLLDDDSITLLALHSILERTKANVIECEDERCALESCQEESTTVDVFVADVILSYSNGPDVVRKVKPLQPRMRLLFISGFGLDELRKRGLLSQEDLAPGQIEFLQKPFPPEAFLASVEKLLGTQKN
jgi:response regulator RpfG family c-di-GMP phosphodiesterase